MNEAAGEKIGGMNGEKMKIASGGGHRASTVAAAGFWRQGLPIVGHSQWVPSWVWYRARSYFEPRSWYLGNI